MKKVTLSFIYILSFTLSSFATLTVTVSTSAASCSGTYNGTITITSVTGGTAPYQYALNGGPYVAGNTFTALASGNYVVSVIDGFGDTGSSPVSLGSTGVTTYSSSNINVCTNELPYIFNGMNINNTGVYTDTLMNVTGCDSVITLNLTVIPVQSSVANIIVCPSQLPLVWNGQSYNAPGIYSTTYTATSGCDSIVTLNLTVTNTNEWIGTTNNVWEDPANWSCGSIPGPATDVIINYGNVVVNANTTIYSLSVGPDATLTINTGINLVILH